MTDFMVFTMPSFWFWLWFSLKTTVADLVPTRIATGVAYMSDPMNVAAGQLPPLGVAGGLGTGQGRGRAYREPRAGPNPLKSLGFAPDRASGTTARQASGMH